MLAEEANMDSSSCEVIQVAETAGRARVEARQTETREEEKVDHQLRVQYTLARREQGKIDLKTCPDTHAQITEAKCD